MIAKPSLVLLPPEVPLPDAEAALSPAERAVWEAFRFAKRRDDWLLGRFAAKRAIAEAAGHHGPLTHVITCTRADGAPGFEAPFPAIAGWDLSITHSHHRAAALVGPGPVGIDLEALRALPEGGWRFYLSPAEITRLAESPWGPHSEIVAWALKEAAYKVWHAVEGGVRAIALAPDGRTLTAEGRRVRARWSCFDGFVLAIATPDGPDAGWLEALPLPTADESTFS